MCSLVHNKPFSNSLIIPDICCIVNKPSPEEESLDTDQVKFSNPDHNKSLFTTDAGIRWLKEA